MRRPNPYVMAMSALPMAAALWATDVAGQDVRIDARGVRAGGAVIDANGVHTREADITGGGVRTGLRTGPRARSHGSRGRGVTLSENGRTASLDCAGGPATVVGNRNTLTLNRCSRLSTPGNSNHIVVSLTAGADIEVTGNGNVVSYHAPEGASARVSSVGSGNRITSD